MLYLFGKCLNKLFQLKHNKNYQLFKVLKNKMNKVNNKFNNNNNNNHKFRKTINHKNLILLLNQ